MIPKIIHYCWFGNSELPDMAKQCIASWREFMPEYKIIEWNESNCDLSHPFLKTAYEHKKWAFVSDYIRLIKLFEFGGIYLDIDMLILKNMNSFLIHDCFFGSENKDFISCGIIGAEINNKFIKKCSNFYDDFVMVENFDFKNVIIPNVITNIFRNEFQYTGEFKNILKIDCITIYPFEYFYPLPFDKLDINKDFEKFITKKSFAVHLWNASWLDLNEFELIKTKQYLKALKLVSLNFLPKNIFSILYYKKLVYAFLYTLKNKI